MDYDFEKLAREIVSSRLKDIPQAPEVAGEIAKKMIVSGVSSTRLRQEPGATVAAVCRGIMGGMLLLDKSLPETALEILARMPEAAQETHLDPQELMTWCMEGIAAAAALAPAGVPDSIESKIESKFMGVGGVFNRIYRKGAGKPGAAS